MLKVRLVQASGFQFQSINNGASLDQNRSEFKVIN